MQKSGKVKLNPEIIGHELKNFGMNAEIIEEIKECIYEKNYLDEYKKENGISDEWEEFEIN